jgi:hypothetical protein
MSRSFHHGERRIRVHAIKRERADLKRLARALISLVEAEAEAEAQAEAEGRKRPRKPSQPSNGRRAQPGGDTSQPGAAE